MNKLVLAITKGEIASGVSRVAKKITNDYHGKDIVLIGILKGSFLFLSDLIRQIELDSVEVDFLQVSSYNSSVNSSENVVLKKDIDINIKGKNVLIVEDIVDTGLTLSFLISHLEFYSPKSIKVCTLIDKKERRQLDLHVDYVCSVMERGFLVGYGLDCAEKYRNLPEIYYMNP